MGAAIEGEGWRPLGEAALWGVNVAAHDTSQSSLLAQMSTLRFGCPSIIRLAGDEFLIAFWCVEDCVSNIRWIKVRIDS